MNYYELFMFFDNESYTGLSKQTNKHTHFRRKFVQY